MSGHSKWATIKRKKAVTDAKKGAIFTRLVKNIALAAKNGKDPDMNPALRTAIDAAKAANMPKENVEKAILKGAGELPGVTYEEVRYEAYGSAGVALIIDCVTDNTNRTVSDLRALLTKFGGSLGNSGSVLYMFEQKGVIRIAKPEGQAQDTEAIALVAIDAGADDIQIEEEGCTIFTAREKLVEVKTALEQHGCTLASSEVEWITQNMIEPDSSQKEKVAQLIEAIEENEDVMNVYSNAQL
ncbi:MAG: YebC/PmpR family DNA-binding transcriptional regulator [Candidatus Kerfeldbacteria bacterium]|nr:YebC/PmpR family DNA-binding transcriptional regulator [Candidatus Kerfeldbacteria bacterium]